MSPKLKFAVLPESPFKTIIGIIDPELLHDAAERWKMKFKQSYSHQVIEDEEVLAREQTNVEAKSGGHVYWYWINRTIVRYHSTEQNN